MTQLLVSVRSAAEAEAALAGGARLIDVKEPAHGSLGRASDQTIADVIRAVAGRAPVSAAMGELLPLPEPYPGTGLAFAKWGLSGYGKDESRRQAWEVELAGAARRPKENNPRCRLVAVAYADWRRAGAPRPGEVCDFALDRPGACAFLLDTWGKDGTTLLDWMPLPEVLRLRALCREAGIPVALAGAIGLSEIQRLREVDPDWFAVRGAVCQGRHRTSAVDEGKVRALAELLNEPITNPFRAG
jgi:uncharacterized protein (UPF0264 family)